MTMVSVPCFHGYDLSVIQFKPYMYTDKLLVDKIIDIMEKAMNQCRAGSTK